ncbi:HNH endonuclease signature motif containing protein [Rummeliibacillus stabekisii]|uniref:HNH endonuclease signature motif containing protein n=1 Tax=Rummeliibacillus stabekisii TaxID=241244 RepID=UPI00371DF33F
MPVKKVCLKNGCRTLIDYRKTYCDKHRQYKNREYNKQIRNSSEFDRKVAKFYQSTEYRNMRQRKMIEVNGLCKVCIKLGHINSAKICHHIVPVREDFDKRLDNENCIMICNDCHEKLHDRTNDKTLTIDELIRKEREKNKWNHY